MNQNDYFKTSRSKEQMVNHYYQESVKVLLFMLTISGLLPPKSCSSSKWKSFLYDVYTALSFLIHIPLLLFQIMGIYVYWGNLQIVTGIIFQLTVCFDGLVILVYFTYHRKYLLELFEMLRTKFLPYINKVGLSPEQEEIMREKTKFANTLATVLAIIYVFVTSAWCVLPFFVRLWSQEGAEAYPANVTNAGEHFKYFVLATWLPDNAFTFPIYEIMYSCQFFYTWSMVAHFTVGNMVFSLMYYGLSLQFRLLAAAIRDIDKIFIDLNVDTTRQGNDYSEGISHDSNTQVYQRGTFERVTRTGTSIGAPSVKFSNKRMSADAYMADLTDPTDWDEAVENGPNCNETAYMIECINYHQLLLK
jgi:hypothetical protein